MKKRRFLFIAAVAAVLAFLIFARFQHRKRGPTQGVELTEENLALSQSNADRVRSGPVATPRAGAGLRTQNNSTLIQRRLDEMRAAQETARDEWRTPIEFYGRVVDEKTNAVTAARVDFDCNGTSAEGTSFYHTQSDQAGSFSIKGIRGKTLAVRVGKEGYYPYAPVGLTFWYAGANENFVPDPENPIVFRLMRRGIAEPLIRFKKSFKVPKDGTPVFIDLVTGRKGPVGRSCLKVECWTKDDAIKPGERFDWKCRISIPDGEIQAYSEQFPFLAPETGYESSEEIDMPARLAAGWQVDVEGNYFYHTAEGKFGRMTFSMVAHGDHFCIIESYLNPSGSRNLEYDPGKALQAER